MRPQFLAVALWFGTLAVESLIELDEDGLLSAGGEYRTTTRWASERAFRRMAQEVMDQVGILPDDWNMLESPGNEDIAERFEQWSSSIRVRY
jgi:hypothetical protein